MKSKQAQELLDKNSTWFADDEKTQSLWVRNYIAEKAIGIAEEEMREKAIELFCQVTCGDSCTKTSFRCCEKRAKFIDGLNK